VLGAKLKWHTPVISALGRLRQEDREFEVSLGSIARTCLRKPRAGMQLSGKALA
jgi:hypothetical protein